MPPPCGNDPKIACPHFMRAGAVPAAYGNAAQLNMPHHRAASGASFSVRQECGCADHGVR
jgi:hypothetical protein